VSEVERVRMRATVANRSSCSSDSPIGVGFLQDGGGGGPPAGGDGDRGAGAAAPGEGRSETEAFPRVTINTAATALESHSDGVKWQVNVAVSAPEELGGPNQRPPISIVCVVGNFLLRPHQLIPFLHKPTLSP
jgi:hypothetical protein